jgi:hypothetical protein
LWAFDRKVLLNVTLALDRRLEIPAVFWMSGGLDPNQRPPSNQSFGAVSAALEWSSRIIAVSLEMVLPGLAGWWLDGKTGTGWFAGIGFAIGLVVGVIHLIAMTRPLARQTRSTVKHSKRPEVSDNDDTAS